jgi:hypothetical protein
MRDRFAVRIRGAGVTGRSPLPVVASAQPLKFVERQPANVPDIFQFSFRRLRPSLVAQFNEGCSCSQLVFCCLTGARTSAWPLAAGAHAWLCESRGASILETAEDAAYRSLRSEKNHTESGEPRSTQKLFHPRRGDSCRCGVRSYFWLEPCLFVVKTRRCYVLRTLEPTSKAGETLG